MKYLSKRNITALFVFSILLLIMVSLVLCNPSAAHYRTRILVDTINIEIGAFNGDNNDENILTNLYGTSEIYDKYYSGTGELIYNTDGAKIASMIISVNPGDKLIANSFGQYGTNGCTDGTTNGIIISYLLDGVWKSSLSPSDVYNEFSTNGYLTVPEGVNQVSVTWWSESEDNYLYVIDEQNLYDASEIFNGYYNASGDWISNSSEVSTVSMVINVNPDDKLIANSFRKYGTNGCTDDTTNGIRISYLLDGVWKSSLSPSDVYNEFSAYGYLTVPEGVNQVSVTWWTKSDENWFYKY